MRDSTTPPAQEQTGVRTDPAAGIFICPGVPRAGIQSRFTTPSRIEQHGPVTWWLCCEPYHKFHGKIKKEEWHVYREAQPSQPRDLQAEAYWALTHPTEVKP